MKKNLQNALLLAMGLMTTVTFAQDWGVDSRTRINTSGDYDRMETEQRATLGATWGGSNWGIHGSTVVNYDLDNGAADLGVYEAYASTDLMGYATVTMGRQALNYGSGMLIGSNEWGKDRNTRDAFTFALGLDMADVTVGYASRMDDAELTDGGTSYWVNASKSDGDWTANLLYGSSATTELDEKQDALTFMGVDLSYAMMGGALNLDATYNTLSHSTFDMDMNSIGATYNVNDDMSITGTMTTYGEGGFATTHSNYGLNGNMVDAVSGEDLGHYNSWNENGNLGYLNPSDKNISIGGAYAMGDFNLGVTMHTITNDVDEAYERNVMEASLGYTLNDNAGLSLKYATDDNRNDASGEEKYMFLTLTVTP
jgi:hypothetical protein